MTVRGNKIITPLYDNILDRAIGYVLQSFFEGDPVRAWTSLKTLYCVLDNEIKKEVEDLFTEVEMEVNKQMVKRGYAASDVLRKQRLLHSYVNEKKLEIFDRIIRLLIEHGYLRSSWKPVTKEDFDQRDFTEEE